MTASANNNEGIGRLLKAVSNCDASDLHLVAGVPPAFRVNGEIILADEDGLSAAELTELAEGLLNDQQRKKLEEDWELCISLHHDAVGRMRVTFYRRNGHPEMSFRFCGHRIAARAELGLPEKIEELARRPNGLLLVTGPTGAGKTTTLNYLIDLINTERRCKIVTIEDPIEFVHDNKRAIVVQQEVLTDVRSLNRALIHVLRQDPDVIVVGEMRDLETISLAITASETGHLVIATLHTSNAARTLDRVLDAFPVEQQGQIRTMVSESLRGIVSQQLIPRADGQGRVVALEIMVNTPAVANLIREAKTFMLPGIIQTGKKLGMKLMDDSLMDLVQQGLITPYEAFDRAEQKKVFEPLLT